MLENETGHRPLAYVKNQQIQELLQESEQKVWSSLNTFNFHLLLIVGVWIGGVCALCS